MSYPAGCKSIICGFVPCKKCEYICKCKAQKIEEEKRKK